MQKITTFVRNILNWIKLKWFAFTTRFKKTVTTRPVGSFFGLMAILLLLIIVGNYIRKPAETSAPKNPNPKVVELYSIGSAPKMALTAKVEKNGIIKVVAQSAGIIQRINVWEGAQIKRGQTLLNLSTTANGSSIPSVQRQLAQKNAQFVKDNYDLQKDLIGKQREIAEKTDANSDELREITKKSLGDTRNLISLNDDIVTTLKANLQELIDTNVGGINDTTILQTKQSIAGVESALSSLRSGLRGAEYSSDDAKPPAGLSNVAKDLTFKQLELQEKTLELNKEISQLNLRLAQISESLMYPASPCSGVIERVHVQGGQSVSPGQLLFTITAPSDTSTAVVFVSGDIARQASRVELSTLFIGEAKVTQAPRYISSEPVEGSLHSILFDIPDEFAPMISNGSAIKVELPVGASKSTASVPFVPLDSVYQTELESYVYVASGSSEMKAEVRPVVLGNVFGNYVEVRKGITAADQVIVDRTVFGGDSITPR